MLFCYYLPSEKTVGLQLKTHGCFVPSLVELVQWFWRRRRKCEKFMTTMTRTTKKIVIRKAQLSLWLSWANKLYIRKPYLSLNLRWAKIKLWTRCNQKSSLKLIAKVKQIQVKCTFNDELLGRAKFAVFHWLPRFPYFVHSLWVWVPIVEMLMFKVFIVAPYMW